MTGAGSAIDYNTLSFTLLSFLFKSVSVIGCPINLKVGMPVFPVGSPPFPAPRSWVPSGTVCGWGASSGLLSGFRPFGFANSRIRVRAKAFP